MHRPHLKQPITSTWTSQLEVSNQQATNESTFLLYCLPHRERESRARRATSARKIWVKASARACTNRSQFHVEPLGSSEQGAARRKRSGVASRERPVDGLRAIGLARLTGCRFPTTGRATTERPSPADRRVALVPGGVLYSGRAGGRVSRARHWHRYGGTEGSLLGVRGRTGAAASMDHHALGVVRGRTDEVSLAFFRPDAISSSTPEAQNCWPSANLSGIWAVVHPKMLAINPSKLFSATASWILKTAHHSRQGEEPHEHSWRRWNGARRQWPHELAVVDSVAWPQPWMRELDCSRTEEAGPSPQKIRALFTL
jgi:hypothetical protein